MGRMALICFASRDLPSTDKIALAQMCFLHRIGSSSANFEFVDREERWPMNFLLSILLKLFALLFNFIYGILAFFIMLLVAIGLTFNFWFPKIVPYVIGSGETFAMEMGKSKSNVFTLNFNFYDVTLKNGSKFPVPNFAKIDRFSADLLLLSVFSKRIVVENFILDVPQLTYIRTADGHNNLTAFLDGVRSRCGLGDGKLKTSSRDGGKTPRVRTVFFKHFELSIGKVISMDFSSSAEPSKVRETTLNYKFIADGIEVGELLSDLIAGLKSSGALFIMQAVMDSIDQLPVLSSIAMPFLKANDTAIRAVSKTFGFSHRAKKKKSESAATQ